MQKQLTITLDQQVYEGLHKVIGQENISQFIESLIRPHVLGPHVLGPHVLGPHVLGIDLEARYQEMAADEEREAEALEWAEATVGDVSREAR